MQGGYDVRDPEPTNRDEPMDVEHLARELASQGITSQMVSPATALPRTDHPIPQLLPSSFRQCGPHRIVWARTRRAAPIAAPVTACLASRESRDDAADWRVQ
jgi:NAD(P)-dependent dehydrogenase (short-subunit alcohol dehydrogenase family)